MRKESEDFRQTMMKIPLFIYIFCSCVFILPESTKSFLFRKKPINFMLHDPYQVKEDPITPENLFAWLNMKNHIKFKLWTRKNPKMAQEIKIGRLDTLASSNFDSRRLTKVLVHGYAHSANEIYLEDWIISLRDAYLHLADLNILIIDYTLFALPILYWSAAPDLAAEQLCQMLKFLVNSGVNMEQIHLLGYSWGAHVAGNAGHKLHLQLGLKIGRITGMDPANPTFRYVDNELRLDKTDAHYVDIIHTNGGGPFMEGHLGLHVPLGHADFYPNSGNAQPGCPLKWTYIYETLECDHGRSVRYFVESITSPLAFEACLCDRWEHYVKGDCSCVPEEMTYMGEHSPHSSRGTYFLFTRGFKPYGLGPTMDISLPDVDEYDWDENNQLKYTNATVRKEGQSLLFKRNTNATNPHGKVYKEVIPLIGKMISPNVSTANVDNGKNSGNSSAISLHESDPGVKLGEGRLPTMKVRKPFVIQLDKHLQPKENITKII